MMSKPRDYFDDIGDLEFTGDSRFWIYESEEEELPTSIHYFSLSIGKH